jgi:hypothetical protein
MPITRLAGRGVVAVEGPDAVGFLQGLITNDVEALAPGAARFAALLTPQGKILFDFIALRGPDGFALDTAAALAPDLAKRLRFYKLRAKVEIADRSDALAVLAGWGDAPAPAGAFADPRLPALGWRAIVPVAEAAGLPADEAAYRAHRIALGVPEGGEDFAHGDAFPHDANMDDLAGVDFAKGCYVGQEVVSRMKHRGTARRRVLTATGASPLPPAGTAVTAGGKPIGAVGSSAGTRGLALVRIDRAKAAMDERIPIEANGLALALALPAYARFGFPAEAAAD